MLEKQPLEEAILNFARGVLPAAAIRVSLGQVAHAGQAHRRPSPGQCLSLNAPKQAAVNRAGFTKPASSSLCKEQHFDLLGYLHQHCQLPENPSTPWFLPEADGATTPSVTSCHILKATQGNCCTQSQQKEDKVLSSFCISQAFLLPAPHSPPLFLPALLF